MPLEPARDEHLLPQNATPFERALPQAALLAQIADLTTRLDEMQRAKDAAELALAAAQAQTAA